MDVPRSGETLTMQDDETPRQLPERTGCHKCIHCMAEVSDEEYFRNDFFCDVCASLDDDDVQRDEG